MKFFVWLLILGALGAMGYMLWKWRERWLEHQRAAEARLATFIAQAKPMTPAAAVAAVDPSLPTQKLLFEAALKAGEAGEAALSIQLYARLLERYPQSAFGGQAQAAIEQQERKLANP